LFISPIDHTRVTVNEKICIALIAALPEEYGFFKKMTGPWSTASRKPFKVFGKTTLDKRLILIETGMGKSGIDERLTRRLAAERPALIISFGFAGGLSDELIVGDVLLAQDLALWDGSRSVMDEEIHLEHPRALLELLQNMGIGTGRVVTVMRPEPKHVLAEKLPDTIPSVMDMESWLLAELANALGVPILCLRAVSDAVSDEIDFDLEAITDASGHVRIWKVLAAVIREPGLLASFYHSWRRSRKAAKRLGRSLATLLGIRASEIAAMIVDFRICGQDGGDTKGI
jgi:nucleoside phosphorylase